MKVLQQCEVSLCSNDCLSSDPYCKLRRMHLLKVKTSMGERQPEYDWMRLIDLTSSSLRLLESKYCLALKHLVVKTLNVGCDASGYLCLCTQ
jgi:hypothetical protein